MRIHVPTGGVALEETWRWVAASLGAAFTHLLGAPDAAFQAFVTLLVLDLAARLYKQSQKAGGFLAAIRTGKISSSTLRAKTLRKVGFYTLLLGAAHQVSQTLPPTITLAGAPVHELFRTIVITYAALGEMISIVETLVENGDDVPKPVARFVEALSRRAVRLLEQQALAEERETPKSKGGA